MSKTFPMMGDRRRKIAGRQIPWDKVEPLRESCKRVHSQTLEGLAQRGGLDICELRGHVESVEAGSRAKFSDFKPKTDDKAWLNAWLAMETT